MDFVTRLEAHNKTPSIQERVWRLNYYVTMLTISFQRMSYMAMCLSYGTCHAYDT